VGNVVALRHGERLRSTSGGQDKKIFSPNAQRALTRARVREDTASRPLGALRQCRRGARRTLISLEGIMEMQRLNGGNLRAAGYDMRMRKLVIELTSGTYEYQGVPSEVWRRFSDASSPWSYYRDNIEEEYTAKRLR
jgi:hypothetical protein